MHGRNQRGPIPATGAATTNGFPSFAAPQSVALPVKFSPARFGRARLRRAAARVSDELTAASHASFLQVTPRGTDQTQPHISAFASLRRWRTRADDFERAGAVRPRPAIAQPRTRDFG